MRSDEAQLLMRIGQPRATEGRKMSIFSKIFGGGSKQTGSSELQEILSIFDRALSDEKHQNSNLPPFLKEAIEAGADCDKISGGVGPFGFCATNPVPVNGPMGQLAYLSRLEASRGQRLLFHRLGSTSGPTGLVDVFEAVTYDGGQWFILYLDFYHPRRSRIAPDGMSLSSKLSQLSGFRDYCSDFPYDFIDAKNSINNEGLAALYIPISNVVEQIENRVFNRPEDHKERLDSAKSNIVTMSIG